MTSQRHDYPLRFMNTIDPIETALAAVTDTERALDAAFSNAQRGRWDHRAGALLASALLWILVAALVLSVLAI